MTNKSTFSELYVITLEVRKTLLGCCKYIYLLCWYVPLLYSSALGEIFQISSATICQMVPFQKVSSPPILSSAVYSGVPGLTWKQLRCPLPSVLTPSGSLTLSCPRLLSVSGVLDDISDFCHFVDPNVGVLTTKSVINAYN